MKEKIKNNEQGILNIEVRVPDSPRISKKDHQKFLKKNNIPFTKCFNFAMSSLPLE